MPCIRTLVAVSLAYPFVTSSEAAAAPQGTWHLEEVADSTCTNRGTNLVVRPNGEQCLLYFYDNGCGGRGEMRFIRRLPGNAWDPASASFVGCNLSHATSLVIRSDGVPFAGQSVQSVSGSPETEGVRWAPTGPWIDFASPLPSGDSWKGGQGAIVALNSQGFPLVAYFYGPSEDANLAEWTGSGWQITTVESSNHVGKSMQLAITSDDRPLMAYLDQDRNMARFAERSPTTGTWSFADIGPADPMDLSIAPNGDPILLRRSPSETSLHVHRRVSGVWSEDPTFPGSGYSAGKFVVDTGGSVRVAAYNQSGIVDCITHTSGGWQVLPVTTGGNGADIAITPLGETLISFVRLSDRKVMTATEVVGCSNGISTYGTGKTNSAGCSPVIGLIGAPTLSGPDNFYITASSVLNNKQGFLIWSGASANTPFHGGTLYLGAPIVRTPVQLSGGNPGPNDCSGVFLFHFSHGYMAAHILSGLPTLYAQYYYRDPGFPLPDNVGLTNALQFTICP